VVQDLQARLDAGDVAGALAYCREPISNAP
jgi:hypothetical protein